MAEHRIVKGLDIPLSGEPAAELDAAAATSRVALLGADSIGLKPTLLVGVGDRVLRGTPLDIFGFSKDRRLERKLLASYRKDISKIIGKLNADNLATVIKIAELPDQIRGYGPVKEQAMEKSSAELAKLKKELAL